MANYNYQTQNQAYYPNQMAAQPFQNQNVQPLFPQPQGNVYNINSTLEVANVPTGAGISVALCIPEGFMYIKTMQNGNPMFWAYKITPYDNTSSNKTEENTNNQKQETNGITEQLEQYNNRFNKLEEQVNKIQEIVKKKNGEWQI